MMSILLKRTVRGIVEPIVLQLQSKSLYNIWPKHKESSINTSIDISMENKPLPAIYSKDSVIIYQRRLSSIADIKES